MISISTEVRQVTVGVVTEAKTVNPPVVSTEAGTLSPPALTVPAAPVIQVVVEQTAPAPDFLFTYQQTVPLTEWSVPHTLGVRPASIQVEVGGIPVIPDVLELSDVRVVLAFGEPSVGLLTLLKGR